MATANIATHVRRRWPMLVLLALLTGAAIALVLQARPVYFSQVRVVFLAPPGVSINGYADQSDSLIDMAGVVARAISSEGGDQSVSDRVTIVGEGIRDGYSVRQANSGGQWQYRFDEPVLEVQTVGETAAAAEAWMDDALARIERKVAELQDAQSVPADQRVHIDLNPSTPQLRIEQGSRPRALAATVVAGLLVAVVVLGVPSRTPRQPRAGDVGRDERERRHDESRPAISSST